MSVVLAPAEARRWLVFATMILTGGLLTFFLVCPAIGYPLEFSQSTRILEIVLPVFLGYLGTASLFFFRSQAASELKVSPAAENLLGPLVKGPIIVFVFATIALLAAFGVSNLAEGGSGMSVDALAAGITAILGLLAVTTNVIIAYLF
jgi:hypothetical protein